MVHPTPYAAGDRPTLELELLAVAGSVAAGRHAVAEFCIPHPLDHGAIAIAVSEALTNVVMHAYRDAGPGPMWLSATMLEDVLRVVVSDDGQGMTQRRDSPGLGMGIPIIARLASELDVASGQGGTRLEMRFAGVARATAAAG